MASPEEIVNEFREVVDIVNSAPRSDGFGPFPSYGPAAMCAGLDFMRLHANASLLIPGYLKGEAWAVSVHAQLDPHKVGQVTLLSNEEQPISLTRIWSFKSSVQHIDPNLNREITDIDVLQDALDWVKSPHLKVQEFLALIALNDAETTYIEQWLGAIDETAAQRHSDLTALARSRRRPMPRIVVD